jgi:hypothetical protein
MLDPSGLASRYPIWEGRTKSRINPLIGCNPKMPFSNGGGSYLHNAHSVVSPAVSVAARLG